MNFISNVQDLLNKYGAEPKLVVDGVYGSKTQTALALALKDPQPTGPNDPAAWITWMKSHIGETENTGQAPTAFDQEVFSHTSFGSLKVMEPGCAATACAALEESGFKSPHSAWADSFRNYGTPSELKAGAICGMDWSGKKGQADHVTFFLYAISGTQGVFLGGNQSHLVKTSVFDLADITFCRWPVKA